MFARKNNELQLFEFQNDKLTQSGDIWNKTIILEWSSVAHIWTWAKNNKNYRTRVSRTTWKVAKYIKT